MPIFKLTEKSNWFVLLGLTLVLFAPSPLEAAPSTSASIQVEPGDTFSVTRPVGSSFHTWKLDNYDVRKLSLIMKQPADTIGNYRFVFRTLGKGQTSLTFTKVLNTALGTEKLRNHTLTVTIEEQAPEPSPPESGEAAAGEAPPQPDQRSPQPAPQPEQNPAGVDPVAWGKAKDQIESGLYQQARETINEQIQKTAGPVRQQWMELKARSYMEQERYGEAIGIWESMLEEFPDGPKAKWLNSIASAHTKNDQPDQAQLSYLEIRHRFPDSTYWPKAMRKLAEIAVNGNNVKRARRILERARSRVDANDHPRLLMKLAEMYDRYPSIRDYPKAVRYYERAARAFDASDTRARAARDRARYLNQNFLKFGTE